MTNRLSQKNNPPLSSLHLDHEIFPGLTLQRGKEVDTITWSNRNIPKNIRLYAVFITSLLVCLALALFLTFHLINDLHTVSQNIPLGASELALSSFFVMVSWVAVSGISYYLVRFSWTETIQISNKEIRLHYTGLLAPKEKRIAENRIWCLAFEKVGNERDHETRFTLNIFDIDDKRHTLAYWLRAEDNYKLFLLLEKIFSQRGYTVQSRSKYHQK